MRLNGSSWSAHSCDLNYQIMLVSNHFQNWNKYDVWHDPNGFFVWRHGVFSDLSDCFLAVSIRCLYHASVRSMTICLPVPQMQYLGQLHQVLPQLQNLETLIAACNVVIEIWAGENKDCVCWSELLRYHRETFMLILWFVYVLSIGRLCVIILLTHICFLAHLCGNLFFFVTDQASIHTAPGQELDRSLSPCHHIRIANAE